MQTCRNPNRSSRMATGYFSLCRVKNRAEKPNSGNLSKFFFIKDPKDTTNLSTRDEEFPNWAAFTTKTDQAIIRSGILIGNSWFGPLSYISPVLNLEFII